MQTVIDFAYAEALQKTGLPLKVHIKVDTGMHRLGIPFDDTEAIRAVFVMSALQVCGIFTHLCCADSLAPDDTAFTEAQIDRFYQSVDALKTNGIHIPKLHIQSSYGLLNYPHLQCDYVRAGIALYGVLSSPQDKTRLQLDLQPVLSLKSRVALIRTVPANDFVGYGRAFYAARESRLAVLPIGYGDGIPRHLSERQCRNQRFPCTDCRADLYGPAFGGYYRCKQSRRRGLGNIHRYRYRKHALRARSRRTRRQHHQ